LTNDAFGDSQSESDHMAESKRFLQPVERVSEILFGLIIVLTFTCSFGFSRVGQDDPHAMLSELISCCLAWGIIDAVFYLLGCISERGHNLKLLWRMRGTPDPNEAKQIIADAMPPLIASNLLPEELESLRERLKRLPEPPKRPWIDKAEWKGALAVFLLAFGSIFPVVLPFVFMRNARLALRISNSIAVILLFLAGYGLGRYAGRSPWRVGLAMVVLGAALVGVAIALGG
jgi:VIT family